jgi:hypothetical protein
MTMFRTSPHSTATERSGSSLVIRPAADADARALEVLAQLDATRVPAGPTLVAEVGGELVAAYGVDRGERIGDPFRPTADVLDLLQYRALHRAPVGRAA